MSAAIDYFCGGKGGEPGPCPEGDKGGDKPAPRKESAQKAIAAVHEHAHNSTKVQDQLLEHHWDHKSIHDVHQVLDNLQQDTFKGSLGFVHQKGANERRIEFRSLEQKTQKAILEYSSKALQGKEAEDQHKVVQALRKIWLYAKAGHKAIAAVQAARAGTDDPKSTASEPTPRPQFFCDANRAGTAHLDGVEIFAAGTYDRGTPEERTYTLADLDSAVLNFNRFMSARPTPLLQPAVVVGHEEDQELLEKTGLPAGGWIKRLWRKGAKLFADFGEIPSLVADWINQKLYRKVSAEFYDNPSQAGLPGTGTTLRRVALLGATPPKVKTLADLPFARFAETAPRRIRLTPGKCVRRKGFVRVFSEVTTIMDRETMMKLASQSGMSQEFLDSLSDEQLGLLVADLAAKAMPGGDAAGMPPPPEAMADAPSREAMIAELVAMGQDQAALEAMDDAALAALYQQLMGTPSPDTMNADPAPTPAPAPTAQQAGVTNLGVPSLPANHPSQVVLKYAETLIAKANAALIRANAVEELARKREAGDKKATLQSFCDRMVREGKLTPAQVEVDKKTGKTLGTVRQRLERANALRKFGEQSSELELQMVEIEAGPVVRKFGETLDQPTKQPISTEFRHAMLASSPEGRAILKAEKNGATATATKK